MSDRKQDWFIAERARTLALVHLTRRQDLVVAESNRDVGLQFVVCIAREEGEPSLRQFGVFLRGTKSSVTVDHLNKMLRPTMQSYQRSGQFPYPVCRFHFTMDDDQGYTTWVAEPRVEDGSPRLLMHGEANCRRLDRSVLDDIVVQVDRWYDAFFSRIAVKAS